MISTLLIEDDYAIAEVLTRFLQSNDISVIHADKPSQALNILKKEGVDIIILDLTLPEIDGLDLCIQLRNISNAPIIISSARSDINDKLTGLENGADDYLAKPYDPRELLARMHSVLKRTGKIAPTQNVAFVVDETSTQIFHNNSVLDLTPAEYQILKLLIDNCGQTISRADIANSIESHRFESGMESINVLIGRLRKKIETDTHKPKYLKTIRGIGYRFAYL